MAGDGLATQTIILAGRDVQYTVRRSPRAKRIGLRVTPARGLEVVLPARGRLPDIPALLNDKAAWIVAALDRLQAQLPPTSRPARRRHTLPYRGQRLSPHYQCAPRANKPSVIFDEAGQTLTAVASHREEPLIPLLEWWYRGEARRIIAVRVREFAAVLGVTYSRLTIRDGRSRWGSCSSLGGLNFSWRLILAPPEILDYVVIHELAHLRELNHSPRFWAIVAAHCPDYRKHQRWLKEHGAELQQLLRERSKLIPNHDVPLTVGQR